MNIIDYISLLPETLICIVAIIILLADLLVKQDKKEILGLLALLGLLPVFFVICNISNCLVVNLGVGGFVFDPFSVFFKLIILLATGLVILVSVDYVGLTPSRKGAYYSLVLFACLGMMLLVSSTDLLMIYLSIEFLGLVSYVLVGFLRKDIKSIEGSVKYFLLGIFSGALMLYGMSLVYGLTGSLDLSLIREWANAGGSGQLLFTVAIFFIIAGFGFKIALVPFHMWVPDAYEGAPTPITAYLSVASKSAGLAVFLRAFLTGFPAPVILLAVLSALTMTVANLIAISQKNIKRLLAYSSISHVGYIMIGFVSRDSLGIDGVLIYVLAYLFMNLGAFTVVIAISNKTGSDNIDDYAGLSKSSPYLSALLVIFLLSLAGIPPMAGFIGKFYVFSAAIKTGFVWLAIVGILNSVVALYYYFRIVRRMYFLPSASPWSQELGSHVESEREIPVPLTLKIALISMCVMVLIIGIFPQYFIEFVHYSNSLLGTLLN